MGVSQSLSELVLRIRREPGARHTIECPVLLWEAPATTGGEHWERTRGHTLSKPLAGDPKIFRVEKGVKANNAFAFGITLGRVDTNDLVIDDDSVSRFHAFLRLEERTQTWFLTDAESKNGTWVDGAKLQPNQGVALHDRTKVKFGDAELKFLLPPSFKKVIDEAV